MAIRTRLKLKPGQRGTHKLVAKYGHRLVCVRYRYDDQAYQRHKTVELIEEISDWLPKNQAARLVYLRIAAHEQQLQQQIHQHGGCWINQLGVWQLRLDEVFALGLKAHIVPEATANHQPCIEM